MIEKVTGSDYPISIKEILKSQSHFTSINNVIAIKALTEDQNVLDDRLADSMQERVRQCNRDSVIIARSARKTALSKPSLSAVHS
jgi:hypothetical protein